jgi:hypothetical protein
VKVAEVKVVGSIDFENVARTTADGPTSVDPSAGTTDVTWGGTGSATVKLHEMGEPSGTPSRLRTELASVAVYVVE